MSFPDSNSSEEAATLFHFHLRSKKQLSNQLVKFNKECKRDLKADDGHFWGYVYFRQVRDSSLKRGYFQKSFVLLSHLPFHNFWTELVKRWAPLYFEIGKSSLIDGFKSVLTWPTLAANTSYELPILGHVYQIFVPAESNNSNRALQSNSPHVKEVHADTTNNNKNNSFTPVSITSLNELDMFRAFHIVIHHIQLIWELILLGQPLLIIAQSPSDCSFLVQNLKSIIAPLEFFPEVWNLFRILNKIFKMFFYRYFLILQSTIKSSMNL